MPVQGSLKTVRLHDGAGRPRGTPDLAATIARRPHRVVRVLIPKVAVEVDPIVLRVALVAARRPVLALHASAIAPVHLVPDIAVGIGHGKQQELAAGEQVQRVRYTLRIS
eukprot:838752-Prymnesium_polylepis.1